MPESQIPKTQIREVSEQDAKRRLRLRVAAKMMMYLGFAGVIYVFISALMSGDGEVPNVPSMRVDIAGIQPGQIEFVSWEGRPVLVYRRTDADVLALRSGDPRIRDPDSNSSLQPEFAKNWMRSQTPEYFVSIALGTGQGCNVEYLPASDELFQGKSWQGGFLDSCGRDRFDVAGRVYEKQYASKNLQVPQYGIDGTTLVLGR